MALITLLSRWGGDAGSSRAHRAAGRARHLRRGAVLRRQHDHPGDLGAVRGRGPQGDRAGAGGADRADHRGDHRGAVRRPAPRHRRGRPVVRPRDDRLVRRDRRVRRAPASSTHPEILQALSPTYAVGFLSGHFDIAFFALAAVVLAVTGAEALYADMGHFGRRAITCGWLGLVLPALHAQLLRPGRADPRRPRRREQPVLPAHPRVGAAADGPAGHRRDRHRVAGGDHRRVLGGVARPPSSATCRGCGSRTRRRRRSARSTCRGSTGC